MKSYNKKKKPKHSTKKRTQIDISLIDWMYQPIKFKYPKQKWLLNTRDKIFDGMNEDLINEAENNVEKIIGKIIGADNKHENTRNYLQYIYELNKDYQLSVVTGRMLGMSGRLNYWEIAILKNHNYYAGVEQFLKYKQVNKYLDKFRGNQNEIDKFIKRMRDNDE